MPRPSVLIVEDDPRLRESFAAAVRSAPDLALAGSAADLPEGLALLARLAPAVVLVDIGLPGGSGIELIREARRRLPHCEVMVVTVFAEEQVLVECIAAGATGYLLKDSSDVDVVQQIRLLLGGGSPISPAIARRLLQRVGRDAGEAGAPAVAPGDVQGLSTQERQVLGYSAKGYSYEETARLLGITTNTVETYVKRIYRKLQVHSKTEAVYEARRLGWVRD